jgi:hypothetical protein
MGVYQGNTETNWKEQWPRKAESSEQENTVILDYNPKYKINTAVPPYLWFCFPKFVTCSQLQSKMLNGKSQQ